MERMNVPQFVTMENESVTKFATTEAEMATVAPTTARSKKTGPVPVETKIFLQYALVGI